MDGFYKSVLQGLSKRRTYYEEFIILSSTMCTALVILKAEHFRHRLKERYIWYLIAYVFTRDNNKHRTGRIQNMINLKFINKLR